MRLLCALLFSGCCALAADSPFIGRWQLDASQSKPDPAGPGASAGILEFTAENGVLIVKAWAPDGSPRPNVVRYDGQEHAAASKSVNPLGYTTFISTSRRATLETLFKKDGNVVGSRHDSLSQDGRTLTVSVGGTALDGRKLHSTYVYHKQ